jgi:hypothetical protein
MNGPLNTVGIASNTGLRAVERYEVIQQESRVSTAVFASSPALVCTIAASERLVFECLFLWQGPNTGTIKFTFATPATPATGGYVAVDGGAAPVGFGLATGFNGGGGWSMAPTPASLLSSGLKVSLTPLHPSSCRAAT